MGARGDPLIVKFRRAELLDHTSDPDTSPDCNDNKCSCTLYHSWAPRYIAQELEETTKNCLSSSIHYCHLNFAC